MAFLPLTSDNFQRSNSSSSLGNTQNGLAWHTVNGIFGITSGRAYRASGQGINAIAVVQSSQSDVLVSANLTLGGSGYVDTGLALRVRDASNFIAVTATLGGNQKNVSVYSVTNGLYQLLALEETVELVPGSTINLAVEIIGNQIEVFVDQTSIIGDITIPEVVYQNLLGATSHGIRSLNDSGLSRWDDFAISQYYSTDPDPDPDPGTTPLTFPLYVKYGNLIVAPQERFALKTALPGVAVPPRVEGLPIVGQELFVSESQWVNNSGLSKHWVLLDNYHRGGALDELPLDLQMLTTVVEGQPLVVSSDIATKYVAVLEICESFAGEGFYLTESRGPVLSSDPTRKGDLYWASSRSVWEHPFPSESVWYRPIGLDAHRVPSGLSSANAINNGEITVRKVYYSLDASYPTKKLTVTGFQKAGHNDEVMMPTTLPTVTPGSLAVLQRSSNSLEVWQGSNFSISSSGSPLWAESSIDPEPVSLAHNKDRSRHGAHGSGLSALGGTINPGELTTGNIHHAIKMEVYGWRFLSRKARGHRWPAYTANKTYNVTAAPKGYNGNVDALRLGSLLTLDEDFDLNSISHPKVRKIATAMKHYGAYVVDNTEVDAHSFVVNAKVVASGEWPSRSVDAAFHIELQALISQLLVVDNNEAHQRCSGGGPPITSNLFAPRLVTSFVPVPPPLVPTNVTRNVGFAAQSITLFGTVSILGGTQIVAPSGIASVAAMTSALVFLGTVQLLQIDELLSTATLGVPTLTLGPPPNQSRNITSLNSSFDNSIGTPTFTVAAPPSQSRSATGLANISNTGAPAVTLGAPPATFFSLIDATGDKLLIDASGDRLLFD